MNTKQQEYKTDIERLRTDMAQWKTDMVDREKRINNATMIIVGGATAFLSVLIACVAYILSAT